MTTGRLALEIWDASKDEDWVLTAGTLEHWLAERYRLYTLDQRRRLMRAEIHHPPWPLQPATASFEANTMPPPGIDLAAQQPPLLHFSRRQDVVIWPLQPGG